uniref:Uncharacterized protein n=1 Tax=Populus trichocarpa TaxID=3694 RepID=A0A3N7GWK0_POPTR
MKATNVSLSLMCSAPLIPSPLASAPFLMVLMILTLSNPNPLQVKAATILARIKLRPRVHITQK